MSSEALFDASAYGEEKAPRKRSESAAPPEPLVYPWVLIADRIGVQGFHIPKHTDKYSTTVTLCEKVGRIVLPNPAQMVRCVECDRLRKE
jgi:hypothetical protein